MNSRLDIVIPSLAVGGAEKMMLLLGKEFQADGWAVRFIIRRRVESAYHDSVKRDFTLVDLKASRVRDFPGRLSAFYQQEPAPDVVLASLWPLTFLTAGVIRLAKLKGTRIICVEHGSLRYRVTNHGTLYRKFLAQSLRWTIRMSDYVVAVSEGLRQEIQEFTSYRGGKLLSMPNPIELSYPPVGSPEAIQAARYREAVSGPVILSVGRLKKVKNIPLLINAFSEVRKLRDAALVIVGDGDELEAAKAQVQSLGLEDGVHFAGFVENCGPYYEMADVFAMSSDSEGFGNVIVEALMKGCTVVSTDCDYGPREILEHGKYGYLSPVGDVQLLAANIMKGLDQPYPAGQSIKRGQEFSPESIYKQYLQLIDK